MNGPLGEQGAGRRGASVTDVSVLQALAQVFSGQSMDTDTPATSCVKQVGPLISDVTSNLTPSGGGRGSYQATVQGIRVPLTRRPALATHTFICYTKVTLNYVTQRVRQDGPPDGWADGRADAILTGTKVSLTTSHGSVAVRSG